MPFELTDSEPPTEFRIFRAGVNTSDKGPFLFDDLAAESVMAAYAKKAATLTMDYEHQALSDPPIEAPASCFSWKPEVRNGELWATDVKWTERAYGMIKAREYTRFSPAFFSDPKTGRVLRILNVALTNLEALDGIEPLMAASVTAPNEEMPMATKSMKCKACMKSLKAPTDEDDGDDVMCTACGAANRLGAVVGLKAGATEAEITGEIAGLTSLRTNVFGLTETQAAAAAITKIQDWKAKADAGEAEKIKLSAIITLTGQATHPAALGIIEGWKSKAAAYDQLKAQTDEAETVALRTGLTTILDTGVKEGKIVPAKRAGFEQRALALGGGKPSKDGIEWLTALVADLPQTIKTGEVPGADPSDPAVVVALTAAELEATKRRGQDPALALKAKQHIVNMSKQRAAR